MRYIKTYEFEKRQFREVDLQQLFTDMYELAPYIFPDSFDENFDPKHSNNADFFVPYFLESIIKKMIIDKEIEFVKVRHPHFDDEEKYQNAGRVKDVIIIPESTHYIALLELYGDNVRYKIDLFGPIFQFKRPKIIKIYNSEKTKMETEIENFRKLDDMKKDAKRYNL